MANHAVIVNERDVFLVDAGLTPPAARALLEDLKLITDKPVRWVVNTHFHYDHTDGNSIFGPEVQIIGHEYVRSTMLNDPMHHEPFLTAMSNLSNQVEALKKRAADEKDGGKCRASDATCSEQADLKEFATMKAVPPTMTYSSKMTLVSGQREIELLFLGRGHT